MAISHKIIKLSEDCKICQLATKAIFRSFKIIHYMIFNKKIIIFSSFAVDEISKENKFDLIYSLI